MMPPTVLEALAWLAAGAGLGAAHMAMIGLSIRALRDHAAPRALALALARLVLAVAVLVPAARQGAGPLLLALAGFLVARSVAVRLVRRDAA